MSYLNIFKMWCKAEFSASLSHDPSEIILICWFAAQETFLLLSMLKTVVLLNISVETYFIFFYFFFRLWNNLPFYLRSLSSVHEFKSKLKGPSIQQLLVMFYSHYVLLLSFFFILYLSFIYSVKHSGQLLLCLFVLYKWNEMKLN